MQIRNIGMLFLLAGFFFITVAQENGKQLETGDFSARDINGKKIQLKKLIAEGPVLIDFWALWCVPCLKALPHYQEMAQKYQEDGLTVLTINEDSPSDHAKG